jgi:hypothetical protein
LEEPEPGSSKAVSKKPAGNISKKPAAAGNPSWSGSLEIVDAEGNDIATTINRNKMHQFTKNFDTFPERVRNAFEHFKHNNPKKAQIVNNVVRDFLGILLPIRRNM